MEIEQNRTPKNYQNGKIYSIRSYQTDLIYIGSTTQSLSKRLSKHKDDFNCWKNNAHHYITSIELLKYDDYYIELIENYPCNSKNELDRREGQLIRETNNCVNKVIPARTDAEYYQDNKEQINEYQKQWYEKNKEQIKEKCKKYREENKEQICERNKLYRENNKEQISEYQKQYREINDTQIQEQKKQYYTDNKEQCLEKQKQYYENSKEKLNKKCECECGSIFNFQGKARHLKTEKHKKYENNTRTNN